MALSLFVAALLVSSSQALVVNPVKAPIIAGTLQVHVKKFAKIPDYDGRPSKIVGIIGFEDNLYVTTSTSGGLIYRVSLTGQVSLWFDVARAMRRKRRPMDFTNPAHGGLRGLAFHPSFRRNGLFYVSCMQRRKGRTSEYVYLSPPPRRVVKADSVVVEFKANRTTLEPIAESYREVLRIAMPVYDHPIKQIVFHGRYLYIGHGDGSVQSAITGGGQRNDGLGKILRINPQQNGTEPYSIPRGNPFKENGTYLGEIYALGFRNPHNLCFSKSGELFVADVGRDNVEEINIVKAGRNYGWSEREGPFVHLEGGGIGTGVGGLPQNDSAYGFTYPSVVVGHRGEEGARNVGQGIAGSCPIENGSRLNGTILYANFPTNGKLFYSKLEKMRAAVTRGEAGALTQAKTVQARVFFNEDGELATPAVEVRDMLEVVRMERGFEGAQRADVRFGRGKFGEIYISSKTNGRIYIVTSTRKQRKKGRL